jgi:1-acyl-sn-glycerol-3-phosphate acyltransferase
MARPRASNERGVLRLALFFAVTIGYLTLIWLARGQRRRIFELRRRWAIATMRALGVEITLQSPLPSVVPIVMPNHRSYIDVAVVMSHVLATVIAKAEIARWPVIGAGCKLSYTIFVDRRSPASRAAARRAMQETVNAGFGVLVFAEGTTFAGPGILELRTGSFRIASGSGVAIMPVAIEYQDPSDAWIGDDTFVPHFINCFSKRRTRVALCFGPPMTDNNPEALRQRIQNWLDRQTRLQRQAWDAV